MEKRWNNVTNKREPSKAEIEAFLDAVEAVCKTHGFSIGHEDGHGSFEINKYDEDNILWLRDASHSSDRKRK